MNSRTGIETAQRRSMRRNEQNHTPRYRRRGIGTIPMIAAFSGLAALTVGLWVAERVHVRALEGERAQTAAALSQARLQIQDLSTRLNQLAEKSRAEAAEPAPARPVARASAATRKGSAARAAVRDPRVDRLQGQLTETQKQLASTRDDLTKAQQELDGKITSTRDDLSGSIAKTHDDVIALQKRGEQNIYEFTLTKSKQLQHVGPLSLSLRSTSVKHKTYDLVMVVDDNSLSKKHINLYEPVWVTVGDRPQPVQLVVNRVGKDEVEGYISEPKYKKSELAATSDTPTPPAQQQLSTR